MKKQFMKDDLISEVYYKVFSADNDDDDDIYLSITSCLQHVVF
jgi:hypothetical protein